MSKEFIRSKEYLKYAKCGERLKIMNTKKNYETFKKYWMEAMFLCQDQYQNFGWDEEKRRYSWDKYTDDVFGPSLARAYTNLFGQEFYVDVKGTMAMFRSPIEKKYYTYNKDELDELDGCDFDKLQKIHNLKMEFDGEIYNERAGHRIKNQELSKRFREVPLL